MLETMFSTACVNPNHPPLSPMVYIEERGGPYYGEEGVCNLLQFLCRGESCTVSPIQYQSGQVQLGLDPLSPRAP